MDDPVLEIRDVVRSLTEPYKATTIATNVEKYFTTDARLEYPIFNQKYSPDGRKDVQGYYKMLRVISINNKIEFHAVMFNEDKTRCALDLTEYLTTRWNPIARYFRIITPVRFLVRIDLRKCADGKYRIYLQHDSFPNDLTMSGLASGIPGLGKINDTVKFAVGSALARLGRFLLIRGWAGP